MAHVAAPLLRQWPRLISHRPSPAFTATPTALILHHLLSSFLTSKPTSLPSFPISTSPPPPPLSRAIHLRSYGLRLRDSSPDGLEDGHSDSDSDSDESPAEKKSRNEKKRGARRAVQWGMELANFSPPRIKRILRAASLDREVFEALMTVKRLGPDVREGKRRQFNYIGRLLRKVQPELMDSLIQASKDGDIVKLQNISGEESWIMEDEEDDEEENEYDDGEEATPGYVEVATRWFDGLVEQDSSITNEVYSVHNVEFDRQELRKLVRRVQSIQQHQFVDEKAQGDDVELIRAKKTLTRFLCSLARQALAAE